MTLPLVLAGDIGATKASLAVVSPATGPRAPLAEETLPSRNYDSLTELARAFLARVDLRVNQACFGVAGPVIDGRARITNLPWSVDAASLASDLGLTAVHLLNDLQATAEAVPRLMPADLTTLQPGKPTTGGTLAVIAPGTGLGQAFLVWDGQRYRAFPSEGGHASFAPTTPGEHRLLATLWERFSHVSLERVCSGLGLPIIYDALKSEGQIAESPWIGERLSSEEDATPVIIAGALEAERPCPLCLAVVETFVGILGAAAGNLALTVLATGGVYVGGGLPPRILPLLQDGRFLAAFRHKGRFADLLRQVPIHIILNPGAALIGAAAFGLSQVEKEP